MPSKATRRSLDQLSLRILEQAAAEAKEAATRRTPSHRLALAWLSYSEIATPDQARDFWDFLGHAGRYYGHEGAFYRGCDPKTFIAAWKRRAGIGE